MKFSVHLIYNYKKWFFFLKKSIAFTIYVTSKFCFFLLKGTLVKYIHHNVLRKHWNTIEMQSNFIETALCKFICIPVDFFKRRQFTKMIWLNLLLFSLHGSNVTSGKYYSEKFYKFHRKAPSGLHLLASSKSKDTPVLVFFCEYLEIF